MRVAEAIVLGEETRRILERQSRGRSTAARVVMRSRIVLSAAEGLQNNQIAAEMGIAPRTVSLWRGRYLELGLRGLLKDAARPGRKPSIPASVVAKVIEKTTQSRPANATHWSRSTMAREVGVSDSTVGRIWKANGLKPHRIDSFKVSNDPEFSDKLEAIVGLYLNPPEHALVLSVDEKSQIQTLDRTQPGLPMKRGRGATMTHDYKRNGTTTLFAALNTANGEVFGLCQQKHRHQEWLRFLRMIDQTCPPLAVAPGDPSRPHRPRRANIGVQHHRLLIHTDHGLPFRQRLFVDLEHVLHAGDVLFIQFRDAPHFFPATASVRGSEAGCGSSPGSPAAPVSASPLRWRSAARSTAPCPVAADRTPWR